MFYRGPGFLAVLWFCSSHTPSPLTRQQIVSLSQPSFLSPVELADQSVGGGWGRSQIVLRRESLILYKSFSTLWLRASLRWMFACNGTFMRIPKIQTSFLWGGGRLPKGREEGERGTAKGMTVVWKKYHLYVFVGPQQNGRVWGVGVLIWKRQRQEIIPGIRCNTIAKNHGPPPIHTFPLRQWKRGGGGGG